MLSLSLSIALSELPRRYGLIRVVTLHAAVIASGPLTNLVGCGVNQYNNSKIKTRLKLQKFMKYQHSIRSGASPLKGYPNL